MKAVILAAGEGMRMRPLTETTPKPLLEVHGKPLIERLVETFPPAIDELVIVVGYRGDQIRAHCGKKFLGRKVSYAVQLEKRGTYHALEIARPLLGERPFALFFADDLFDRRTITELVRYPLAAVTAETADPRRFGVVELTDSGYIRNIAEKPEHPLGNIVLTSAYMLSRDIFNHQPEQQPNGEYYLSEAIAKMATRHPVKAVPATFWFPIGTPEDLEAAHDAVLI